ncbi:MAG: response regulator [Chloroflexota bacterium]
MPSGHILIVDDEPNTVKSLTELLTNQTDFTVSSAADGHEAKQRLEEAPSSPAGPVDLVILDWRMPGLSGLEVLTWLRNHPTLAYTRVIMCTAFNISDDKVEALSAGADDYVTKPYHNREMLARVETTLRSQRLEKQLQEQTSQLAALNKASNAITTSLEIGPIAEATVDGARQVLRTDLSAIFLPEGAHDANHNGDYDGKRSKRADVLHCRAVSGVARPDSFHDVKPGQGAIGSAYASQQTLCYNDLQDAELHPVAFNAQGDSPRGVELKNLLVAPLMIRSRSVGVLLAANKKSGPFGEVDQELFTSLASAVSRALENAWLFQNVRTRQQELQESHNRLQAVINGILNPIYTIDENYRLMAVNRHKADELQTTPNNLVGRICYRAFFRRRAPCEHCLVAQMLAEREAQHWSVRWVGDDHLPQEWDVHAYPLPRSHSGAPSAVVVWQDRTEERRLENSLLQAGKLAAIGQLAAGVAHEINNPLTAINANSQMLKMVIPQEDDMYEAVDLIARAGARATKVVRGLLDFARQNQYSFEHGDVNNSVMQALNLVAYQLRSADIEIDHRLQEDLPQVRASWEHLKTVWLNLLINARDAVVARPGPRNIEIETRLAASGDHVQVLVTDDGIGLSPAEAAHIFEPFYTTKEPGQGTGLGLATSQRIVQQHGGDIEVVSRPGEGATFVVRLPVKPIEKEIRD